MGLDFLVEGWWYWHPDSHCGPDNIPHLVYHSTRVNHTPWGRSNTPDGQPTGEDTCDALDKPIHYSCNHSHPIAVLDNIAKTDWRLWGSGYWDCLAFLERLGWVGSLGLQWVGCCCCYYWSLGS